MKHQHYISVRLYISVRFSSYHVFAFFFIFKAFPSVPSGSHNPSQDLGQFKKEILDVIQSPVSSPLVESHSGLVSMETSPPSTKHTGIKGKLQGDSQLGCNAVSSSLNFSCRIKQKITKLSPTLLSRKAPTREIFVCPEG